MFSLLGRRTSLCDGISRRELMRIGGLGLGAVSLPDLLQAAENSGAAANAGSAFGRAKNVIFLYLAGGPPQHETFDPKPKAPAEIRGEFKPISTNIPGIQFCELLPRTARIADKLAVVRSMSTDDNIHSSSSHWVLTGYKYQGPNARTISPSDWPYFGSIIKRYRPSDKLPALSTVWLPDIMRLNENVTPAGQSGGLMGKQWDPERFVGDPSSPTYKIEGLQARQGIPPLRMQSRKRLLDQMQQHFRDVENGPAVKLFDTYQQQALDLMLSGKAQQAFNIRNEPDKVRNRYGRNRWGQCVLLARRLVEAGVRLVHVQWPREDGDNAVDNPLWDTHAQNFDRVEDVLCPMFDVGFTALIEDLDHRGLLDETLVVAIGEFGRTPKINPKSGRDHWGPVFSFAMAGAGISGGQVFGSSDANGAYPKTDKLRPGNLTATIFHLLGLDHRHTFSDREGRELALTREEPLYKLLGTKPATNSRRESEGSIDRVPPYDPKRFLAQTEFRGKNSIRSAGSPSRPKGWRAEPLSQHNQSGLAVRMPQQGQASANLGLIQLAGQAATIAHKSTALLAQEVRSPFAGVYELTVRLDFTASSAAFAQQIARQFECRISYFQFLAKSKDPRKRRTLFSKSIPIQLPKRGESSQEISLVRNFYNPRPGGNFSFGLGLGVAVEFVHTGSSKLVLPKTTATQFVQALVHKVDLEFRGKEVNPDVTV